MSRQLMRQDVEPRYRQLADILAREVRSEYAPGDLLPSELVLARRFSVNRHTVRRALDELVAAGMVTRHQGLGTQVVDRRLDYNVSAASKVTHNLAELGLQTESRCLAQALAVPPEAIAQRFGLEDGQPLLCVDTLRFVDGAALLRLRHWFDPERVPDWTRRYRGGSTRALLDQHYGLRLTRSQVRVEACQADAEDCRLLQCSRHAPLLVLTSDNVDDHGRLVEVSVSRARADRVGYHVDFSSTDHPSADMAADRGSNGRQRRDQDHYQNEVSS
ncbi:phosphonate metabolism transcriptional regulator PhnF [Halomonas cupida]|uniref:GntR family transcriptional regulator, phosphonate transport system regulatory protein n=1 Tax=Halomonas cupida TaxID=44933 RepID=A0A1M7K9Q6_9GAMM|nr:phosphonate metabolism transcriptional regulator PhnF [Halomonas cupida]GEN24957.1 phosphonate metabolism transcriptional regulator PhnF [Halomonas cupida]SHM61954.1 GntR family transcriptional regulator, phosphonate transport system regulatory protein [Halomonas cupida]